MEKINYPNIGNGKNTEQNIQAIRDYLNELADLLNHNFERTENRFNEISGGEK